MYTSCSAVRDDIPLELIFIPFMFSSGIGNRSSAGYDRKVLEYRQFLRNHPGKYNLAQMVLN